MRRIAFLTLPLLLAAACGGDSGSSPGEEDVGASTDVEEGPAVQIQRIDILGVQNADSCDENTTDLEVELLFSLLDADDRYVEPGVTTGDGSIFEIGTSFSSTDIALDDVYLFPTPDIPCSAGAQCTDWNPDAECIPLNADDANSDSVCGLEVEAQVIQDSLEYEGVDTSAERAVFVAFANGASILGTDPETGSVADSFSSDPADDRVDGVATFLDTLADYAATESTVCIAGYTGSTEGDFLQWVPDEANCTGDLAAAADAAQDRQGSLFRLTFAEGVNGGERASRGAVREGLDLLTTTTSASLSRHVVLFTDGPDNGSSEINRAYSIDRIVGIAAENNVGVHVVQLDNPPGGETGPDDQYARMGCGSNGTYLYSRTPDGVVRAFRNIGLSLDRRYSLRMRLPFMDSVDAGAYRLGARITMSVGGDIRSVYLNGDNTATLGAPTDTRLAVFARPVPVAVPEE